MCVNVSFFPYKGNSGVHTGDGKGTAHTKNS